MSAQFSPELIDLANAIRETEAEYKRLSALKDESPNSFIAYEIALRRCAALKIEFNRILDNDIADKRVRA